ncbi:NADP-dependent oxidoreductase [Vibrio sp. S4M6]|uniref:NADP-dependent oxidoreductase n=1 Tax=Vibrio sinus TaxID=2946865 RepID=UPI002029CC3F|nr:NADP-dependent oxidoreductase [Vibrio sinus]MCL9779884.1 NADP-dependent oxidoreductase [Vibrio sinus]
MNQRVNPSVILHSHPDGEAQVENFRLENRTLEPLKEGEFLIENIWLSLDPYTRPRLNKNIEHVEPIPLGGVIQGETVGRVIESKSSLYQVDDIVFTFSGWQKYCVCSDRHFLTYRLPDTHLPESVFLSAVGTPGRAAYFGLNKIGRPVAGETLVVSAASGAVGSIAGQLGKLAGCHVVGIAGSKEKCRYVVEELGFDACVNYKEAFFADAFAESCPRGVDVYFENVGGRVSSIVARHLNDGARVPICGGAALYNKGKNVDAFKLPRFYAALPNTPEHRFFLVTEWVNEYPSSISWLLEAVESGQLKYKESITEGLENAPQAFIDMLCGRHFGKQLVRV